MEALKIRDHIRTIEVGQELRGDETLALAFYKECSYGAVMVRRVNMSAADIAEGLDIVGRVWIDSARPLGIGVSVGLQEFAAEFGYSASLDVIGHARALLTEDHS